MKLPPIYLGREAVREIDRRAIADYGLTGLVLMENAGRGCADQLCELGIAGPVVICCGGGNNGGDGFVIARHLDLRGYEVKVLVFAEPERITGDAAANLQTIRAAELPIFSVPSKFDPNWLSNHLAQADWIVDAILGTGARGTPREPLPAVLQHLNGHTANKLAIDLPSGLDCDTGVPAMPTFRADHTCTFVAGKAGFRFEQAQHFLGVVHILDIGAPRKLLREMHAICPSD